MKKHLIVTLILAALSGCTPKEAFEAYCRSQLAPSELEIETVLDPVVIDNSQTRAQISAGLRETGTSVEGGQAMGSTAASLEQKSSFRMDTLAGPGLVCGRPHAKLTLRMTTPHVLIAKEFAPNSCRYRTVELHEFKHVQAYKDTLFATAKMAEVLFRLRFASDSVHLENDMAGQYAYSDAELNRWMVPMISRELERVRPKQRAIDSVEEYTRITNECPEEPLPDRSRDQVGQTEAKS